MLEEEPQGDGSLCETKEAKKLEQNGGKVRFLPSFLSIFSSPSSLYLLFSLSVLQQPFFILHQISSCVVHGRP
jgi:hypothetical protein